MNEVAAASPTAITHADVDTMPPLARPTSHATRPARPARGRPARARRAPGRPHDRTSARAADAAAKPPRPKPGGLDPVDAGDDAGHHDEHPTAAGTVRRDRMTSTVVLRQGRAGATAMRNRRHRPTGMKNRLK